MIQYSGTHRTNVMSQLNTDIGANAVIKVFTGAAPSNCGVVDSGTDIATFAGNAGGFGTSSLTLSGVTITGTAGQFSCTAASQTLAVGMELVISGTLGGSGTITGYANPTNYWITATNGSTTFTLSTSQGGTGVVTTTGTPTGLTYTVETGMLYASAVAGTTGINGGGTAGYFRIYPSVATTSNAVAQGTCFMATTINTSALSAAGSNVLSFASTTGVANGMSISGTGVPVGATVLSFVVNTSVTMSAASVAGVSNATPITFGGDMVLTNTNIANGQTVNFTSLTVTAYGA